MIYLKNLIFLLSITLNLAYSKSVVKSYRVMGDLHGNFLYGIQLLHTTGAFDFSPELEREIQNFSAKKFTFNFNLNEHGFEETNTLIQFIKAYTMDYLEKDEIKNFNWWCNKSCVNS